MPRYGNLDELKREFEWLLSQVSESSKDEIREHIQRIDNAPTVDAAPVVRCEKCKHFEIEDGDTLGVCKNKYIVVSNGNELYPPPDFHCKYGERRNDGK